MKQQIKNDKVLNVLIQYFDSESNKIVIDHLGSRIQNVATAGEIVASVSSILTEYGIAWEQIISVLMYNCSTMRGLKGGVETLIRKNNRYLLDISGDTIHMLSNVAKTLMKSTDQGLQDLRSNIYYDIEKSPKQREIFCQIMTLMNAVKMKHIIRPIDNRFLQMQDVTTRLIELVDYITVYYASYISEDEKTKYRPLVEQIYKSCGMSEEAQAAVEVIKIGQEAQQQSSISHDRKSLILDAFFTKRTEIIVKLKLCRGLLGVFQEYVKKFQSEVPQIHLLHENMVEVTKKFLSLFINPEHIPERVSKLMTLDVENTSIQKSDRDLSVGQYAQPLLTKARMDKSQRYWIDVMSKKLRNGYIEAAKKILKLPLDNQTLRYTSVLDSDFHNHSQCSKALKDLARRLPHIVPEEKIGQLDMELNSYAVDKQVAMLANNYDESKRVDVDFWVPVMQLRNFALQRCPYLTKLAFSLLTAFSGPLVEGSFNIMGDIIKDDRAKMQIENYEAVAIIKMELKRKDVKTHQLKITPVIKSSVINSYSVYKQHLESKKEAAAKKEARPAKSIDSKTEETKSKTPTKASEKNQSQKR